MISSDDDEGAYLLTRPVFKYRAIVTEASDNHEVGDKIMIKDDGLMYGCGFDYHHLCTCHGDPFDAMMIPGQAEKLNSPTRLTNGEIQAIITGKVKIVDRKDV